VTSRILCAVAVPLTVGLLGAGCRERATSAAAPPRAAASAAPSGDALVYERVVGGNQDLYIAPAGGGTERRLTDDPALDGLPRWTADGRRVLFTSERSGKPQIYELTAEGGALRRVRENDVVEYQVDESADGRRLAFLSNAEGAEHLWLWTYADGPPRVLVRHGRDSILGNPDWSPDGRQIVFSSNWRLGHQIYVADTATGEARRISPLTSGGCEPRFSPDGRKVVYVSRGHLSDKSRLVAHDLASGDETVLVDWPALNYDPAYAPDGSEIAFASNVSGEYVIYRQRLSDGKAWRVTFGPGGARYPDYRPTR
jgi:Tol biopolymer transport system component